MTGSLRERASRAAWARHANPKSGWSRTVTLPAIVAAVYHREWRVLAAALAFTVANPVLFPKPGDADAWMTRVVLAERHWVESGDDLGLLRALTAGSAVATLWALSAAVRRDAGGATVGTSLAMTLKSAFVAALVRRYDGEIDWEEALADL